MRLTMRTNLAMRALMFCAVNDGRTVRKSEIAAACNASENHLGLVINQLGQHGFIRTLRGRAGGIRLARKPEAISVGDVIRVFESCLPFAECFDGAENECPLKGCCKLRGVLGDALEAFYGTLDPVSLADLTDDNQALYGILSLEPA